MISLSRDRLFICKNYPLGKVRDCLDQFVERLPNSTREELRREVPAIRCMISGARESSSIIVISKNNLTHCAVRPRKK